MKLSCLYLEINVFLHIQLINIHSVLDLVCMRIYKTRTTRMVAVVAIRAVALPGRGGGV